MNSLKNCDHKTPGDHKKIPRGLHYHYSQKLMFRNNKSTPLITKRNMCSKTFHIVIHNKLNRRLKKFSYKFLQNLKSDWPLEHLHLRYGFSHVQELTFVSHVLKHFHKLSALQLRIINESTDLERLNDIVRSFRFFPFLKTLDFAASFQNPSCSEEFKLTKTLKYLRGNLEVLALHFGTSLFMEKVCQGIRRMTALKDLNLNYSSCGLMLHNAQAIADCFHGLENLTHLKLGLSHNSIPMAGFSAIMKSIKDLTKLKTLEIGFDKNLIFAENFGEFNEAMVNLKELEVLDLNLNGIKIFKNSIMDFGEGISHLTNLKVLKLSLVDCRLKEKQIINLGKGISALTNITEIELDLTHNELDNKEISEFIECLRPLKETKIFSLSLARNPIIDLVMVSISSILSQYRKLEKVSLNGFDCKLTDKGISKLSIFPKILNLKELTLIFTKNRNIQAEGVKKLMDGLSEVKGLQEIRVDFAECQLSSDLEDYYSAKLKNDLPECRTTILFGI